MRESWLLEGRGKRDIHWDLYWGELNADNNSTESYLFFRWFAVIRYCVNSDR